MALDFGSSANGYYVDCGNPNSWNLGADAQPGTLIAWFWPDSVGSASEFPCIISKTGTGNNTRFFQSWAAQHRLEFLIGSGVDSLQMISGNNALSAGKWQYVCATWEQGAGDTAQQLWVGDLTTLVAEVGSYNTQGDGSSLHDSSSDNLVFGVNTTTPDGELDGEIAMVAGWNGVRLNQAQLAIAQFKPWLIPTLSPGNLEFYHHLGIHGSGGTGTQRDWSGNGYNGTVTSATKSDHAPITIFPYQIWMPQPAGALSATVNQVTETDLAQTVSWAPKHRLVDQVTESDTAQALSKLKLKIISQAAEADVSQLITRVKALSVSQVTETDLAQPISTNIVGTVSLVTESDIAQAFSALKTIVVSQATETDLAQAISGLKTLSVTQVTETDLAQAVSRNPVNVLVVRAEETDEALGIATPGADTSGALRGLRGGLKGLSGIVGDT